MTRLLIIESHPVQYRTPLYERLNQLCPNAIHVAFGTDFSVRGGYDKQFNAEIAWDSNLLSGFSYTVLNPGNRCSPSGWNDIDGKGLHALIVKLRPKAILLTSLNYRYDFIAYATALLNGIPVWMRCETQDFAFRRPRIKSRVRSAYYRVLYRGIKRAFPIGKLNREHWLRHGMKSGQLTDAYYCTPDRIGGLTPDERLQCRNVLRSSLGLSPDRLLIAFFGKLIPKKNPSLLLDAIAYLPHDLRHQIAMVFVGNGPLKVDLEIRARTVGEQFGIPIYFPGFINQSALPSWYLAADIVVLPSRRAGETWGLVVNEALQAGCSVVVSDAVGCSADFGGWQRLRTIPECSAEDLSEAIQQLWGYERSFTWAAASLSNYSIEAAAKVLAAAISDLP